MKWPSCVKEVPMLNGHLVTLNRFISRSTNKCKPFFQASKKNGADFHWNEECETTFQGLKRYMTSPPLLSKPPRERRYIFISPSQSQLWAEPWFGKTRVNLYPHEKTLFKQFLSKNADVFAWSPINIPGIDPEVICHNLSIKADAKLVKQKSRRMNEE